MTKPVLQTVTIDWNGFILDVSGQYEQGDEGLWTYPNGDPGYPSMPPTFYIEGMELIQGELFDLINEVEAHTKTKKGFVFEDKIIELVIQKIEEE